MPFLLRTASALATGFLLSGPSASVSTSASGAIGGHAAPTVTPCTARWATGRLPLASALSPAGFDSQIISIATVSPTDAWMLVKGTDNHGSNISAIYHRGGDEWRESAELPDNAGPPGTEWIVARSDTDVWVIAPASGGLQAWQYDGSSWTDHPPARYSSARVGAAALGGTGALYLAGRDARTGKGIILGYDGSRWADLTPVNPPHDYDALAVTADGTLIAAGGNQKDGALQERAGTTWTTVSLSTPVDSITRVSVTPGGTVYGVGSAAGGQPVLIKQPAGSRSATVLDPSTMELAIWSASKTSVAALGLDVWLLGGGEPHDGWHHPWFGDGGSAFGAVRDRFSHRADGDPDADSDRDVPGDPGSGQPCWYTAVPRTVTGSGSLPVSSRCGRCTCHPGSAHHRGGARQPGCRCAGLSLPHKDPGTTW